MSEEYSDVSKRVHEHIQKYQYKFQSETSAPRKGSGDDRRLFSIEDQLYVSGVGWEILDPKAKSNPYMIGVLNYMRQKEAQGYRHAGLNSVQYKEYLENLWGIPEEEW